MTEDLVFFKKEGEEGVALTSTSANHIANLAKEYIQDVESKLNNIKFYDISLSLVGSYNSNPIQVGNNSEVLEQLQPMLEQVAQAKSLIAWLREAIKAKANMLSEISNYPPDKWGEENGVTRPVHPNVGNTLSEEEYYNSLSVKERNRYYQLETEAAVIGSYIHPNGKLATARKKLKDVIQHPNEVDGKGRDALIYTNTPTVTVEEVDNVFFELQKKHREIQAQLNSMKHSCEQAINESASKVNTEFHIAMQNYQAELFIFHNSFKTWKDEKTKEYSKLKIVIPNSLLGIYNIINSLGK